MFLAASLPALAQDAGTGSSATYNETRLSALEAQMRDLNGRLEQVEFNINRVSQVLQRQQSDDDARFARLESAQQAAQQTAAQQAAAQQAAAPPPPPPPVQVPSQPQPPQQSAAPPDLSPSGTLGALKVQDGKVTGAVNNPQAPPLPNAPPDYGLTVQEQYDRAFGLLREENYPEAEKAFKTFIDKNPKDKLIENAKYWYGETLYVRARFDEAAVAFADAFQQNPQGPKAPDCLLKLGMSLGALNKINDACVTLNELKSKYPRAPETIKARAKEERAHLKCPIAR